MDPTHQKNFIPTPLPIMFDEEEQEKEVKKINELPKEISAIGDKINKLSKKIEELSQLLTIYKSTAKRVILAVEVGKPINEAIKKILDSTLKSIVFGFNDIPGLTNAIKRSPESGNAKRIESALIQLEVLNKEWRKLSEKISNNKISLEDVVEQLPIYNEMAPEEINQIAKPHALKVEL